MISWVQPTNSLVIPVREEGVIPSRPWRRGRMCCSGRDGASGCGRDMVMLCGCAGCLFWMGVLPWLSRSSRRRRAFVITTGGPAFRTFLPGCPGSQRARRPHARSSWIALAHSTSVSAIVERAVVFERSGRAAQRLRQRPIVANPKGSRSDDWRGGAEGRGDHNLSTFA
jgi:hypothetical protein